MFDDRLRAGQGSSGLGSDELDGKLNVMLMVSQYCTHSQLVLLYLLRSVSTAVSTGWVGSRSKLMAHGSDAPLLLVLMTRRRGTADMTKTSFKPSLAAQ